MIPRFLDNLDSLDSLTVTAQHGPVAEEQCHGRIFRENPLFTVSRVMTNAETVVNLGASDNTGQLSIITGGPLALLSIEASAEIKVGDPLLHTGGEGLTRDLPRCLCNPTKYHHNSVRKRRRASATPLPYHHPD